MSEYINEIHDDEIDVRMEDEELEVKKREKSCLLDVVCWKFHLCIVGTACAKRN